MAFYGKINGEWQKLSSFETYKDYLLVATDGNNNVFKLFRDGSGSDWNNSSSTNIVSDVDLDEDLNLYTAGQDGFVRKIDPSGVNVASGWPFESTGVSFTSVSVAPRGYVYASGDGGTVWKLDASDGGVVWQQSVTSNKINGLSADFGGNVYTGDANGEVIKTNAAGDEVWSYSGTETINDVNAGADGSVYVAAYGSNGSVYKVGPAGNLKWNFNTFDNIVNDVAINERTGAVYGGDGSGNIQKFTNATPDSGSKTSVFSAQPAGSSVNTIDVDENGYVYTGDSNNTVRKLEDTGGGFNTVWSASPNSANIISSAVLFTTKA